jgi:CTP synthase
MARHKYIFVVGGVMSGVGKGITVASIGKILSSRGFKVNLVKIDPYLNVDAGTMNPTEHGEVFVLDSGLETDQDMGNYERFLGCNLRPENYMTSGMVYRSVIERERSLGYHGKFVEAIPHVRDEIIDRIKRAAKISGSEISVIEIGGTIGDFQNALFIEAARVMHLENPDDVVHVMVSYLPVPATIGEMKTRPTQHAVRALNSYGIQPHFIVARSAMPMDQRRKEKLAIWCNVRSENIISAPDIKSIYDVPLNFERDGLSDNLLKALHLKPKQTDMQEWRRMVARMKNAKDEVRIAIVGKYFKTGDFVLSDVYISVIESLKHAATAAGKKLVIEWLDSGDYEAGGGKLAGLSEYHGILVPGGFGERGVEGKIRVIQYAREKKIPYFGLCYGMQLAVIEYARNVAGLKGAHTTEVNPETKYPVIDILPEQKKNLREGNYGGTMRLGAYPAWIKTGTIAYRAYKSQKISERHRHRYEVNPEYVETLASKGLVFSASSPDGRLQEICELPEAKHPFFVASQFHPEFKSAPLKPHPLFLGFVRAAAKRKAALGRPAAVVAAAPRSARVALSSRAVKI